MKSDRLDELHTERISLPCFGLILVFLCLYFGFLASSCTAQDQQIIPLKRAKQKVTSLKTFTSFIKDREYSDSPYEISSRESEHLLQFIEKTLSKQIINSNDSWQADWNKEFIVYLRQGHGEYLKISEGIYIIHSYFLYSYLSGVWLADMKSSRFEKLAGGYGIEITNQGVLADGTGWILCGYGGLTHSRLVSGYSLITYIKEGRQIHVESTRVADEVSNGDFDEPPKKASYEYLCGSGEQRIEGIAGEILGYEWKDVNGDSQKELIIRVEEKDCRKRKARPIKRSLVYAVSKGRVLGTPANTVMPIPSKSAVKNTTQ